MNLVVLLVISVSQPYSQSIWSLRSGLMPETAVPGPGGSAYMSAIRGAGDGMSVAELRNGLASGHTRLKVPLAAALVSAGDPETAEMYWMSQGNLPATRGELLSALAWHGRYLLYPLMTYRAQVPVDMEGRLHGDHCAAVCAAGWMRVRNDGLFHPDDPVTPGDLSVLSGFFPVFSGLKVLRMDDLNRLSEADL